MNRARITAVLLLVLAGCQLPPERVPLKPLAENGPPQPYADLVSRARAQAAAANEAFYINNWPDLEDAAQGLEVTARVLAKAADIPAKRKADLLSQSAVLTKEASQLREAAKGHDVRQATETLQRINLKIRELRPDS
jgi:hypothetical protein